MNPLYLNSPWTREYIGMSLLSHGLIRYEIIHGKGKSSIALLALKKVYGYGDLVSTAGV